MAEFVSNLDPEQAILTHDQALIQGRAADGGVLCFNPNKQGGQYPKFSDQERINLTTLDYIGIAKEVVGKLVGDELSAQDISDVAQEAYKDENFPLAPDGKVVTVTPIADGVLKGDVSNGQTGSFKDNGMTHLAANTERVVSKLGMELVIASTSTGDTDPAAKKYFRDRKGIQVVGFSPEPVPGTESPSSPFQRAQSEAYTGGNIHNIRAKASFDKLSAILEKIKSQPGFEKLGAVNSVNIARIAPQVITFAGICVEALGDNINDQKIDVVIPSGNFGHAFAAYIARAIGLPIDKIIIANTKENNALHNLVQDGTYEKRDSKITIASAMDIMAPANLPRLIFDMLNGDVERMTKFINRYRQLGSVALTDVGLSPNTMREWGFDSGTASRQEITDTISAAYIESGIVIDPHTAVALTVAKRHRHNTGNVVVAVETALSAKFEDVSQEVLGFVPRRPEHLVGIEALARANRHRTKIIEPTEAAFKGILAPLLGL